MTSEERVYFAMLIAMFMAGLLAGYGARACNERACPARPVWSCSDGSIEGTGSSGDPLHLRGERMKKGDRVVVTSGEHAGRHGTISFTYGDNPDYAKWYSVEPGQVRVALDGEAGRGSQGGRGGVPINIEPSSLAKE